MEQGSDEWYAARLGKVTASRAADVLTKKGSAARSNLSAQLVLERITKTKAESFQSPSMQWGIDQEPTARLFYEASRDVLVETAGFVQHPSIEYAGASPDGLVGANGLVEIKCPNTATMIDIILTKKIPTNHITQMQMQMACTQRDWCDYVVFDPRMPPKAKLFIKRINRDKVFIDLMEKEIILFLKDVESNYQSISCFIEDNISDRWFDNLDFSSPEIPNNETK